MAQQRSEVDRVLAGRYRLTELLGEGGMGTIWRAEHLVLQAPVAVKLIDRDVAEDEDTVTRFIREAQSAAALRSPHVVQILDYGVDDGTPFIVMELLEGETLAQRIKNVGRLSPADTTRIITHVARAVGRAHEAGIVHRDLKPENVFIVHNEDEEIAKVLDFGVAKINKHKLGPGARTRTGSLLGTPYYMSPEQAQGNKDVDFRSDLWSLAVIAYESITGKRPFYSDGLGDLVLQICVRDIPVPSEIAPVPIGFDAWFARATDRDPEKRFQSAREMTDALREALGIEARMTSATFPEIVVQHMGSRKRQSPTSDRPPAPSRPPTEPPAGADQTPRKSVSSPSERPPISEAATSAADSDQTTDGPALTVRQFGTTHGATPVPRSRSGIAPVIGVAGAALAIGIIAGIALFARSPSRADSSDIGEELVDHLPAHATPQIQPKIAIEPKLGAPPAVLDAGRPLIRKEREPDLDSGVYPLPKHLLVESRDAGAQAKPAPKPREPAPSADAGAPKQPPLSEPKPQANDPKPADSVNPPTSPQPP